MQIPYSQWIFTENFVYFAELLCPQLSMKTTSAALVWTLVDIFFFFFFWLIFSFTLMNKSKVKKDVCYNSIHLSMMQVASLLKTIIVFKYWKICSVVCVCVCVCVCVFYSVMAVDVHPSKFNLLLIFFHFLKSRGSTKQ